MPPGGALPDGTPPGGPGPDDTLIEAVAGAYRPPGPRAVRAHPNWYDLDEAGRRAAFERASALRRLEAALDPEGLSTTARAILRKVRGERGPGSGGA
ncbi:MAG TPA: hypothetical protein VFS00_12255 [Polyangiaceae bacterium]|nr:hypothetical protein [Polyangiaceae bacterium]